MPRMTEEQFHAYQQRRSAPARLIAEAAAPRLKVKADPPPQLKPSPHPSSGVVENYLWSKGIAKPVSEYRFRPDRRWRFDYAWLEERVALEVQSGIWSQGRHTRGAALLQEWEKLNAAAALGWRILYCQPSDLLKPETIEAIRKALDYHA